MTLTQDQLDNARLKLRKDFEDRRRTQRANFEVEIEQKYLEHLANEKSRCCSKYRLDAAFEPLPWPYPNYSSQDLYRVSLPHDLRLEELLKAGLLDQALRVWLFRHEPSCRATVQETVDFLKPYIPVAGDYKITTSRTYKHQVLNGPVGRSMEAERTDEFVEASNLSKELHALLTGWCIYVERGHVVWSEGRREYIRPEEY
jgi:hypothetical protein